MNSAIEIAAAVILFGFGGLLILVVLRLIWRLLNLPSQLRKQHEETLQALRFTERF